MTALEVRGLTVRYGFGHESFAAVDSVDLSVPEGGTRGLVGESGSGKSTIARAIVGLVPVAAGKLLVGGVDVANGRGSRVERLRAGVQMVFQDPYSSLNPRMMVGEALGEAVAAHRQLDRGRRAAEIARLLELVDLPPDAADRFPHQFSGGQRQRIAVARALATQARLLILDEVTSSLDVSVQATILTLLRDLQKSLGLSYLFISHDLSVVRLMSSVVSVMYFGRIVEARPAEELFAQPRHPYTQSLIDAIPKLRHRDARERLRLSDDLPDPRFPPSGCRFRTRCPVGPLANPDRVACLEIDPNRSAASEPDGRVVACHFPFGTERANPWQQSGQTSQPLFR